MPNPTITPWAPGASFTVTGSTFAAADIFISDAVGGADVTLTMPVGATLVALLDPGSNWGAAGTPVLNPGAWVAGPILVGGQWTLTVTPATAGTAATDPMKVSITDLDGSNANGTLRLIARMPSGNAIFEPGGGSPSIDRVLADPSITGVQVTSSLPVEELATVNIKATVSRTESVNGGAVLAAPPPIVSIWAPEAANSAAVDNFMSAGDTATFKAPAAYAPLNLTFKITAAYNLDGAGLGSASNPRNSTTLPVAVQTVTHGMLLVLDRSGSMGANFGGGQSRWQAAVRAAHAWLDLFRAFRPAGAHKAGILTFEHDGCGWKSTASAGDITLRNPVTAAAGSMGALTPFGDVTELNLGTPQSCTPIGDALVAGFGAISDGLNTGSETKRASVLLLTDGYENSGNVTIAASVGSALQTFAQARAGLSANTLIADRLFTMAVGQQVDADRLNDLGTGWYQMASEYKQMLPGFAQMLGKVLDAQPVMPVSMTDPNSGDFPNSLYFPMATGDQKIAFLVPWSDQNDSINIAWRPQGSAASFTAVNPLGAGVKSFRRKGHGVIVADIATVTGSTGATEWRVQHFHSNAAQAMTNDSVLCMADLMLKAEVAFDKRQYFIGDPINLSCGLVHGGAPVSGATVQLDVARPGEGLGTFLGTNADRYRAMLRDLPSDISKSTDQYKGKAHMHAVLLRAMQLDHIPDVTPPVPGLAEGAPGQYASVFTDTPKEGTYTFRWRIEGSLPDGSRYTRVLVRATWVGVRPDPGLLGPIWQTAAAGNWTLTIKPKTASGELLGPFRHDTIDMKVAHGSFDGDLVDNLDGSYSRKVKSAGGRQPVVSIDIYGTPMNPAGPGIDDPNGMAGLTCRQIWWAAWLCLIRRILGLFGIKP